MPREVRVVPTKRLPTLCSLGPSGQRHVFNMGLPCSGTETCTVVTYLILCRISNEEPWGRLTGRCCPRYAPPPRMCTSPLRGRLRAQPQKRARALVYTPETCNVCRRSRYNPKTKRPIFAPRLDLATYRVPGAWCAYKKTSSIRYRGPTATWSGRARREFWWTPGRV